jgi:hypothetical protein
VRPLEFVRRQLYNGYEMNIRAIAERADAAAIQFRQPFRPQQLPSGTGRISAIAIQNQYAVAAPGKRQIVQHQGGRRARFARSLAQQGERLQLMAQIEVLQRLVEQHERRILRPQLGEPRALALAAR